jgi:hypothetical protein
MLPFSVLNPLVGMTGSWLIGALAGGVTAASGGVTVGGATVGGVAAGGA